MLAYLYCAAYTRMTMNESSPPCEQRRITFNDDGQRMQLARPELPAPHYICMYRLLPTTPPSPSRHYYLRLIAGTNLPAPKGWIAWLAKKDCTHITFAHGYYTTQSIGTRRKWTQVVGFKINTIPVNQPRCTNISGELNLRKLPGRQWESNPQPTEQLRPMTIKTSASTEAATTAYILLYIAHLFPTGFQTTWMLKSM